MIVPLLGRLAAITAFALLSGYAAQAQCSGTYSQQVCRQLDGARSTLAREGFAQTHDYTVDRLNHRQEDSFTVTLRADREYAFVGACDADCSDMDFWLYDENDNLIDEDTGIDDVPIVRVTPRWSGTFRVRVRMYACSTEPCYYGIGVFGN